METLRDPAVTYETLVERSAEFERLQRERFGDALDAPMVRVVRIVDLKTGRVLREWGDGSPRRSGPDEASARTR